MKKSTKSWYMCPKSKRLVWATGFIEVWEKHGAGAWGKVSDPVVIAACVMLYGYSRHGR
jgi:hypothetical protein